MGQQGLTCSDEGEAVGDWVFGYGSLVAHVADGSALPATLSGWERTWGVAMENSVDLAGYKHYLTPGGERPDVAVAFLDVIPRSAAAVAGCLREVSPGELALLDLRERNYERVDVTSNVPAAPGTVHLYVGSADGRERYRRAVEAGRCVVHEGYLETCRRAFAAYESVTGSPGWSRRDEPVLPVLPLVRMDR